MTIAEILARLNTDKLPRKPGQWTPTACALWRAGPQEVTDLVYALLLWELSAERICRPEDEPVIRERMARIAADVAAARALA